MALSNWALEQMIRLMIGEAVAQITPQTLHLHIGDPGVDGDQNEVPTMIGGTNTGYAAKALTSVSWELLDNNTDARIEDVQDFGTALQAWGIVSWYTIKSGVNLIESREFTVAKAVEENAEVSIPADDIRINGIASNV